MVLFGLVAVAVVGVQVLAAFVDDEGDVVGLGDLGLGGGVLQGDGH